MAEPLISVIIPVYNVESYLERCLESIIHQTYRELEIFLMDDGSTDASGRICDRYAERDHRVKVIHKQNGGLSDARNAALDVFSGEYVTFVDSDDYVARDYIEYLYGLIRGNDVQISVCQPLKTYGFQEEPEGEREAERVEVLESKDAIESFLYQRKFTASAWAKLYDRRIFDGIRYPVGYYYEDMAVICQVLASASRIAVSNRMKYYYFQRSDGIMGRSFNPKKMHRIKIAEDILGYIKENYPQLARAAEARCFLAAVQTYRELPPGREHASYRDEIWHAIRKYRNSVIGNSAAKASLRIMALSTYLGKSALALLGRLYTRAMKNSIR